MRQLTDEDLDAIAQRVAQIVASRQPTAGALIDAAEVARRYGVTRTWVYDHADQLGAIHLGDGTKPRLRFDPDRVGRLLAGPPAREEVQAPTLPRPRRRTRAPSGAAVLLPILGKPPARPWMARLRSLCALGR